jgi:hypothetical protein
LGIVGRDRAAFRVSPTLFNRAGAATFTSDFMARRDHVAPTKLTVDGAERHPALRCRASVSLASAWARRPALLADDRIAWSHHVRAATGSAWRLLPGGPVRLAAIPPYLLALARRTDGGARHQWCGGRQEAGVAKFVIGPGLPGAIRLAGPP